MLILNFLLLVIGFVGLIKGADWFVDGSAGVARKLRVSSIIIGLTIVAMGTSAPELAVSTTAALKGSNEIALSNVVGSNIFNLMVVLGVCAVIHSVPVDKIILKRDFPFSIGAMILTFLVTGRGVLFTGEKLTKDPDSRFLFDMADDVGMVSRPLSITLLVIFTAYILLLIYDAKKHPEEEEDVESMTSKKCLVLILTGLAFIIAGGQAVVYSAQYIARSFGMTETLIGLTVVALGTSLPELVTAITSLIKGHGSLSLGNIIGANLFNLVLVSGLAITIRPFSVPSEKMFLNTSLNSSLVVDIPLMLGVMLILTLPPLLKEKLYRWQGILLLMLYAGFCVFQFVA